MEWLKNAIKSYDTLITEALDANDEAKLKEHCSKAPKPKIALVMCTLLGDKKLAQISLLLKHGGDFLNNVVPFGHDPQPCTPLVCAVKSLDVDMVQLLIGNGADAKLLFPADEPKNSALHEACRCNNYSKLGKEKQLKIINLLLDKGADVNSTITFEKKHMSGNISLCYRTPLMVALCDELPLDNDDVKIFKTLLERKEYDLSVTGEVSYSTIKKLIQGRKESDSRNAILKLIAEVEARPKADGRSRKSTGGGRRSRAKKDGRSRRR